MSETSSSIGDGLRNAATQVLASALDLGRGRLELVMVELEEERLRLARLVTMAACSLFLVFLASVLGVALVVLVTAPADRALVLGVIFGIVAACAGLCTWQWRRMAARKPLLLETTLDELHKDRAAFAGAPH